MYTLPNSQSEELEHMSEQEPYYDEHTDEWVIPIDQNNTELVEALSALLRENKIAKEGE